ncbi:hypothetical protein [Streptantibioticus ferralitis]|uniref:Uncharacterized protein n=1 Tax=Streptantibioticus ferralitis TaxID=236510 RepID=A0ABT5YXV9_9ACTN|nr:hypothetical protein [Streptantibioticus ferralitis]MDF2256156.1 hypothetical protein [Streptantibioticus ferralitis]
MMSIRRAVSALFAVGIALGVPATAVADAGAAGQPPRAAHHCYTVEQARVELARRAAAVTPGKKVRLMVPVCQSTGTARCDAPSHTLLCGQFCQDCDGLVCSQPYFSEYACGSC